MIETKLPKNVSCEPDRHGNIRYYFRKDGRRTRLRETPGTEAFEQEVACARLDIPYREDATDEREDAPQKSGGPGSLDWLIDQYEKRGASLVVKELADRRIRMFREVSDSVKNGRRRGRGPYRQLERRHVIEIRDELRDLPSARNNVVKAISALYAWAIEIGEADVNPAHKIKLLKSGPGFHTWTIEEVDKFIVRHPRGTKAYRTLVILLFTGLRRGDAVILGRQHLYWQRNKDTGEPEQWLRITPKKTSRSSGVEVNIPVLPELATELSSAGNDLTFLLTGSGAPFTPAGFGNKMRQWCNEAELPNCTAHGLRKAGCTIAAENGADHETLKSIYGWSTVRQADVYVQRANRKKIAAKAGRFLFLEQK